MSDNREKEDREGQGGHTEGRMEYKNSDKEEIS